jgi:hypothetical protein
VRVCFASYEDQYLLLGLLNCSWKKLYRHHTLAFILILKMVVKSTVNKICPSSNLVLTFTDIIIQKLQSVNYECINLSSNVRVKPGREDNTEWKIELNTDEKGTCYDIH